MLAGEVFLAGGALQILPHTLSYHELSSLADLRRLPEIVERTSLTMGTGHPQGGNLLSANPRVGVVGADFRAHGYDNLFVCDASVFPTSLGVNPQSTVMALADYAVPFIADASLPDAAEPPGGSSIMTQCRSARVMGSPSTGRSCSSTPPCLSS